MRLWHIVLAVFLVAVVMAIARDQVGRVALVIFFTAIGEVFLGVSSILMLFRTVSAFGAARTLSSHLEALLATASVLFVGGTSMLAVLWFGARTVQMVT